MSEPIVIRGRFQGGIFTPDVSSPDIEGRAVLVVTPESQSELKGSVFDHFGAAEHQKSDDQIGEMMKEIRGEYDYQGGP